jgi:hypothetical protein
MKYRGCALKPIQIGSKSTSVATRTFDRLATTASLIAGMGPNFRALGALHRFFSARNIDTICTCH